MMMLLVGIQFQATVVHFYGNVVMYGSGVMCYIVVVVVVVVNFIKHQNRAITGERVAARAAPYIYIYMSGVKCNVWGCVKCCMRVV